MKKKILSLVLVVAILVIALNVFVACDKKGNGPKGPGTATTYDIPEDLSLDIAIMKGNETLGTLTKDNFKNTKQQIVHVDTINDKGTPKVYDFVAYKLTDLATTAKITLPTSFSKLQGIGTDGYKSSFDQTSIDKTYISIGMIVDGKFEKDTKDGKVFARLITDKDSKVTSTMIRLLKTIVFDPVEEPVQPTAPKVAYEITLTWGEGNNELTAVVVDKTGDKEKSNTIVFTTANEANTFTKIDNKAGGTEDLDLGKSILESVIKTKKDTTEMLTGYELKELLDALKFRKKAKDGQTEGVLQAIIDSTKYDFIGWVCSDDNETTNVLARSYTKDDINNAEQTIIITNDSKNNASKVVSTFDDVDGTYRNNSKKVTKLVLYKNVA